MLGGVPVGPILTGLMRRWMLDASFTLLWRSLMKMKTALLAGVISGRDHGRCGVRRRHPARHGLPTGFRFTACGPCKRSAINDQAALSARMTPSRSRPQGEVTVQGKLLGKGTGKLKPEQMAKAGAAVFGLEGVEGCLPGASGLGRHVPGQNPLRYTRKVTASEGNAQLPASFKAAQAAIGTDRERDRGQVTQAERAFRRCGSWRMFMRGF